MSTPCPRYRDILSLLERYAAKYAAELDQTHHNAMLEIRHRLRRLDNHFGELMNLNAKLIDSDGFSSSFDPETDTITWQSGSATNTLKLRRADPNVPIKIVQEVRATGYPAGDPVPVGRESSGPLRQRLEELIEPYYYDAHRTMDLVKTLPHLKKFACREISIVRNKLVEHPANSEGYSFGYGSSGPTVRPLHLPGREWIDAGALPNTEAFVAALKTAIGALV